MRRMFLTILFGLVLNLVPSAALAAEPPPPPQFPIPENPVEWTALPDLMPYVQLMVPQCGQCNAGGSVMLERKPPPQVDMLLDPFSPFKWLAWALEDALLRLICWLLSMLQMLANLFAMVVNLAIWAANQAWHFLVFAWITLQQWSGVFWYLIELIRWLLWWLQSLWTTIEVWGLALLNLLGIALSLISLVGESLLLLVTMGINIFGWIGAVALTPIVSLQIGFSSTTTPTYLIDNHVVYFMIRGTLDALLSDFWIGLFWRLLVAGLYIGGILFVGRFLSTQTAN